MTRKRNSSRTTPQKGKSFSFLLVAAILVYILHSYFWQPSRFKDNAPAAPQEKTVKTVAIAEPQEEKPDIVVHELKIEQRKPRTLNIPDYIPPSEKARVEKWKENAVDVDAPEGMARIVIIIDDVGVNYSAAKELMDIKQPLTMAFLPYARNVESLAAESKAAGHELMIHMPMEPMNTDLDTGDIVLKTGYSLKKFDSMMDTALASFDGYVGVNNHMGSKFTADPESMRRLMDRLYEEGLLFVDSRTIHTSVAEQTASDFFVPNITRDVFLDHDPSEEGVRASLAKVERIAREYGKVVAIGHPKAHTIKILKEWLPTLTDKNMVLVPVSTVIKEQQARALSR